MWGMTGLAYCGDSDLWRKEGRRGQDTAGMGYARSRQVFPHVAIPHQSLQHSAPWGNVDVQQKPPIQVTLLKEGTSIPCKVIFPYMPKYTKFSICYYRINSLDQKTSIHSRLENVAIPSGEENKTAALSYDYRIMSLENTSSTGTYYCKVKWNDIQKMGKGVFVLVRGVFSCFSSFTSGIRDVSFLFTNHVKSVLEHLIKVSLDVQQVDVYSSLENNTSNPSHRKNSPGKTPKKQETLEECSDTLYENI
ncbi:hypothetical protein DUI87_20557 [Hirundo rustica rustica]|uniref:NFAM1 Ig-like domain-containing protein n=1 Tax=Hirundo rustica rustica TaxID=333673 RepID=A0A3M0JT24_HIRRU|nr:hypothetical protein DUI87_20557 [Hirundo rustica rustica]